MSVGEVSDGTGGKGWTVGKGEGREGGGGLVFGESDAVVDALGVGACLIDIPGGKSIVLIFIKGHNIRGKA